MEEAKKRLDELVEAPRPSPWSGVRMAYSASLGDDGEYEYEMPGQVGVGLLRSASGYGEQRVLGDRWRKRPLRAGTIGFAPPHAGLARWKGSFDGIGIWIDVAMLHGIQEPVAASPFCTERPVTGIRDRIASQLIADLHGDYLLGAPRGVAYGEFLALSLVFRLCATTGVALAKSESDEARTVIDRAIEYVHAHMDSQLSVREVAVAAGYVGDMFTFSRRFRRQVGMPPHQYMLGVRLDLAKRLLQAGDTNVTSAALQSGFRNVSHFSDAFKHRLGVTPSSLIRGRVPKAGRD